MKMVNFKFGLRAEYLPCLIIPCFKTIPMTKGFPTCSSGGLWIYKKRNVHVELQPSAVSGFGLTTKQVSIPSYRNATPASKFLLL